MSQIVIKPARGLFSLNFPELWRYRELFYIFAWRDLKVRYKQTILGVAWAVFQPFITMVVFTVFFGRFLQNAIGGVPYPVFVYTGLVFWNLFSHSLSSSSNSLVDHENIIKKIYFPRLIIPIAGTLAHLVDFVIATLVLLGLMFYFKMPPAPTGLVLIPLLTLLTVLTAIGIGLFLAAVNAKYRDVRYAVPFFVQLLLFVTPVIYPTNLIGERFAWLFYFNPMAGIIEAGRSGLLQGSFDLTPILIAAGVGLVYFLLGLTYFRKSEGSFADVI